MASIDPDDYMEDETDSNEKLRDKKGEWKPRSKRSIKILNETYAKIELYGPGTAVSSSKGSFMRCIGPFRIPSKYIGYTIVRVKPKVDPIAVHHIVLYGESEGEIEEDLHAKDGNCWVHINRLLFAWSRVGMVEGKPLPSLDFRDGTGFTTSPPNDIREFWLEVHYDSDELESFNDTSGVDVFLANLRKPRALNVISLVSFHWVIPPYQVEYEVCEEFVFSGNGDERGVKVYGARGHAHAAGLEIYTSVHRNGTYIGSLSHVFPNKPQTFYLTEHNVWIQPGDSLALHCVYNTEHRDVYSHAGMDSKWAEMCNHYLLVDWVPNAHVRSNHKVYNGVVDGKRSPETHGACAPSFPRVDTEGILPSPPNGVGDITGVAANSRGEVFAFHRAGRVFSSYANLSIFELSTIDSPTIVKYSPEGDILAEFGLNLFHLPHGIACDCAGDLWTTDIVSNTVYHLSSSSGRLKRKLEYKFDKPTDVAFDQECSKLYVADGYGNSRVVVFNYTSGDFLFDFGSYGDCPGCFNIVHSVTVDDNDLIYVADRQNYRVQIFSKDGVYLDQWSGVGWNDEYVYWHRHLSGIKFDPVLSIFWTIESSSLVARTKGGMVVSRVDDGFFWPHSVEISPSGDIYVAELKGRKVTRFSLSEDNFHPVSPVLHYTEH